MVTIKREKELPAVANGSDDGGGKRQCTRSAAVPIKQESEETKNENDGGSRNKTNNNNKQQQPVVIVSPTKQNDENDALPTSSMELSKVLCRIVDTDHYSREEGFATLKKLNDWLLKKDVNFLKYFHFHGGIIKVLDFLTATMNDVNCMGDIRFSCIGWAARVIGCAAKTGVDAADNKDIILKILASAVDYGGLDILINASEEYIGGNDTSELKALAAVWFALSNMYESDLENEIMKEKANAVFETGIDVLSHLKLVVIDEGSSIVVGNILYTFALIIGNKYVTKDFIQNNNCISKCVDVFKKNDGTWKDEKEFEIPPKHAISFFSLCYLTNLLNVDSDYELLLSFFAFALKTFGTDKLIRDRGLGFLNASFSFVRNKNIIKRSKCMEALGFLLGSNEIDEDEKRQIGALIGKIATLP